MTAVVVAGDPQNQCASFTRFVLPFAYRPRPSTTLPAPSAPHWRPAKETDWLHAAKESGGDSKTCFDRSRRRYLTEEIERVLFDAARWFVLEGEETNPGTWKTVDFTGVELAPPPKQNEKPKTWQCPLKANLRPPALVLFEWPDKGASGCCEDADELRTGLLIIEAWFSEIPSFSGLLMFNELFRYWRKPYEDHDVQCPGMGVIIKALSGSSAFTDDDYTAGWARLLRLPIAGIEGGILPEKELGMAREPWRIHADDRAFVSTCVIIKEEKTDDESHAEFCPPGEPPLAPLREWGESGVMPDNVGAWVNVLNVDNPRGDKSIAALANCSPFERDWLAPRTYRRWLHYGTAYGFTAHSAAMLAAPNDEPPAWRHFGQMYFDQLLLMLYLRTTLFRFSQTLSDISARMRRSESGEGQAEFADPFINFRMRFDLFTNLYQFPLLSNQQQAVEMYAILREQLDIKAIYDEIHAEIDGTDEVIELQNQSRLNKLAAGLGVLGFVGVLGGLVQAVMSLWNPEHTARARFILFAICGISLLALAVAIFKFRNWLPWLTNWLASKPKTTYKQNRP